MTQRLLGTRFEDKYSARQIKAIARYHLGIAKYLFIHIPKNGGLTIRNSRAMRRQIVLADPYFHKSSAYTQALAEAMHDAGMHHGNQHARLIDVHPNVRRKLPAVAIVRNPWSRTWSRFTYLMRGREKRGEPFDYSAAAFDAFLEERHVYGNKPFFWHRATAGWYPQVDYVRDETRRIACDILRLEHFADDVGRFFGVSDIEQRNRSKSTAPRYSDAMTDRHIQIVADWYADDIETFGFDFIGGATRNILYSDEETSL